MFTSIYVPFCCTCLLLIRMYAITVATCVLSSMRNVVATKFSPHVQHYQVVET